MDVLFVGNGINTFAEGYSWDRLMQNLFAKFHLESVLHNENAPFPLVYEEIYFKSTQRRKIKESKIKNFIAEDINLLNPSNIHEEILNSGIKNIITTNYDYTLQKVKIIDPSKIENLGKVKESLYSLFRYNIVDNQRVWHVHGEMNVPRSIILGYEHYSGNLQAMRNYIVNGTRGSYKNLSAKGLIDRLNDGTTYSWIDYFFKHNIHIVGLKLDFEEIDLWWLLTYRARVKNKKKGSKITNKITYYIPRNFVNTSRAKLEFLKATGVTISVVEIDHSELYYSFIIKKIQSI
ncbi:SIR2 family protein [Lewinella sp. IMCC34191]|uniref:SIR2 family protein n=1 Tax=Lewinella sp. IMCC34191 TaxID=2259172 RepID=UPI000E285024|nr:SIR2 family protein [Lewinella sp. IMCC34191]